MCLKSAEILPIVYRINYGEIIAKTDLCMKSILDFSLFKN